QGIIELGQETHRGGRGCRGGSRGGRCRHGTGDGARRLLDDGPGRDFRLRGQRSGGGRLRCNGRRRNHCGRCRRRRRGGDGSRRGDLAELAGEGGDGDRSGIPSSLVGQERDVLLSCVLLQVCQSTRIQRRKRRRQGFIFAWQAGGVGRQRDIQRDAVARIISDAGRGEERPGTVGSNGHDASLKIRPCLVTGSQRGRRDHHADRIAAATSGGRRGDRNVAADVLGHQLNGEAAHAGGGRTRNRSGDGK